MLYREQYLDVDVIWVLPCQLLPCLSHNGLIDLIRHPPLNDHGLKVHLYPSLAVFLPRSLDGLSIAFLSLIVCIRVSLTLCSLQFSFCSASTLSFKLASRLRSCGFAFLISLASIMINGNGTKIKFSHLWPTYLSIIFIVLVSLVVCGVGLLLWKMGCWPLRDTWKAKWRILMDTSSALCNVITHQSGITVICL